MRCSRPSRSRRMSPARSSTRTCLEIAGADMLNGAANAPTLAAPSVSRWSIRRRAGWASAENTASSGSARRLTMWLTMAQVRPGCNGLAQAAGPSGQVRRASGRLAPVNPDLHAFVREALARGTSRDDVRKALRDARWPDDEIEAELAAWHDAGLGLPVPRRRLGFSPREAFLYLVAFPVYLYTSRITGRAVAADPEKRNSGVRRWLTYLTLFNAACVLIGDFIVVLSGLLKGELTARFVSKAAIVAAIGGWMFAHYMGGLRRDESPTPRPGGTPQLARVAGAIVVLVALTGMWLAGSPARARRQELDQRRVRDLNNLSNAVGAEMSSFGRFPPTLGALVHGRPR